MLNGKKFRKILDRNVCFIIYVGIINPVTRNQQMLQCVHTVASLHASATSVQRAMLTDHCYQILPMSATDWNLGSWLWRLGTRTRLTPAFVWICGAFFSVQNSERVQL